MCVKEKKESDRKDIRHAVDGKRRGYLYRHKPMVKNLF